MRERVVESGSVCSALIRCVCGVCCVYFWSFCVVGVSAGADHGAARFC